MVKQPFSCGGTTHSIEPIYGGDGKAVHAEWVSDTLIIRTGKPLCRTDDGPGVREKDILIRVDHGNVVDITERDNKIILPYQKLSMLPTYLPTKTLNISNQ